jgi:hypothetical protein
MLVECLECSSVVSGKGIGYTNECLVGFILVKYWIGTL